MGCGRRSSRRTSWRGIGLGLVIAGLTQAIYPYLYDQLIGLDFTMLLVLSARNILYVALLIWAIVAVVDALRYEPETRSA